MWERLIRNVKTLLKKNFAKAFLTSDELCTIFVKIEGILNSRPITYVYSESSEPNPLTPNDLLLGGRSTIVPSLGVEEVDLDVKRDDLIKREEYHRLIVKRFWRRWNHEYLNELRKTNELNRMQENFPKPGQVVLIVEDNVPRPLSKLGVIHELHPGIDGVVRAVTLKTKNGMIKRPVQRLVMLEIESCEALQPASGSSEPSSLNPPYSPEANGGEDVAEHARGFQGLVPSRSRTRGVKLPSHLKDYVV